MEESTADVGALPEIGTREQAVQQVVEAVADAEGVDPLDLEPLSTAVDVDALESLFRPQLTVGSVPDPQSEVRFEYHGYEVRFSAIGRVTLSDA